MVAAEKLKIEEKLNKEVTEFFKKSKNWDIQLEARKKLLMRTYFLTNF